MVRIQNPTVFIALATLLTLACLPSVASATSHGEELNTETESILYVIDVSCSMGWDSQSYIGLDGSTTSGTRLTRAKDELKSSIAGLAPGRRFEVVTTQCQDDFAFAGELVHASMANKQEAFDWIDNLQTTGVGGFAPCLAWALQYPAYDDAMTYLMITDGRTNGQRTSSGGWATGAAMIAQANSKDATCVIAVWDSNAYLSDIPMMYFTVASYNGGYIIGLFGAGSFLDDDVIFQTASVIP